MDASKLKKKFGQRVRSLRSLRGMTQERLAEKSCISPEYVSKIERGLASPSFKAITRLASALGVKPARLFEFSDLEGNGESL